MRNILLILFILMNFNLVATNKVEETLTELKQRLVPDKRVGVWDLDISNDNGRYIISGKLDNVDNKAEIDKSMRNLGVQYDLDIKILPEETLEKKWGIVSISVACIRTNPRNGAELASQAIMGTPMKILEVENGMARVQTPDNYIGYMTQSSFTYKGDEEIADWRNAKRYIVAVYQATLWEDKTETIPVTDLVMGNILEYVETDGQFLVLALPDGRKGYINKLFVSEFTQWAKQSYSFNKIKSLGYRMLGTPYLWGGTSTKTLDCSGFVKTLYFHNGIILQRDASQQYFYGGLVDWHNWQTDAKPGDLIFIGTKAGKVTHVAMYIGNGKFIHSSGRVKINSLDKESDDYLDYTILGMRRINGYVDTKGITSVKKHSWYLNQK